jgi:trehalose 6-phosphate synthase
VDAFNFVQTCRFYIEGAHAHGSRNSLTCQGRTITAQAYPISVDPERLEALADDPQTQAYRQSFDQGLEGKRLILRVDRVEPSKNILRGLRAFHWLLHEHPEHRGKVVMLALLVPSRMEVTEYKTYLKEILAEGGLIDATYSDGDWEPVRIILGNNYERAIAAMQLYSVLLVNPLADGMNLVAKEGALVNQQDGVLVLSEFAGAVHELGEHALTVSPFDVHNTAEALHQALIMPQPERQRRAAAMREQVRRANVQVWFDHQLDDALKDWYSQPSRASTPSIP